MLLGSDQFLWIIKLTTELQFRNQKEKRKKDFCQKFHFSHPVSVSFKPSNLL